MDLNEKLAARRRELEAEQCRVKQEEAARRRGWTIEAEKTKRAEVLLGVVASSRITSNEDTVFFGLLFLSLPLSLFVAQIQLETFTFVPFFSIVGAFIYSHIVMKRHRSQIIAEGGERSSMATRGGE